MLAFSYKLIHDRLILLLSTIFAYHGRTHIVGPRDSGCCFVMTYRGGWLQNRERISCLRAANQYHLCLPQSLPSKQHHLQIMKLVNEDKDDLRDV